MSHHEGESAHASSGWIQMSLTVSDMSITTWTQQRQVRYYISTVAATLILINSP